MHQLHADIMHICTQQVRRLSDGKFVTLHMTDF